VTLPSSNPYLSDPDVGLMLEFQRGSPAAFDRLLQKYYPRVLNFICRYGVTREAAEDLTQDVFLKIYKAAANYRPRSKFQTWAFTIARNAAFNAKRSVRKDHVALEEEFDSGTGVSVRQVADDRGKNASQLMVDEEERRAIEAALASLPENQRTAVLLKRFEQMSYEEIAGVMNCSVMSVKSLLNRAKETLRIRLAGLAKE
jgi:RNA polymerase sigma-70 factor (ECF subfamily)